MFPIQTTEYQWFQLMLRLSALERNAEAIRYGFVFDSLPERPLFVKCYVYYDPGKMPTMELAESEERREIYLEWRKVVEEMIGEATRDTPNIRATFSADRDLRFIVLEGYGMGSKKVFDSIG
jgi:hypothetical protein